MQTVDEGNIVDRFYIDNTEVKIADNFCRNQTEQDIKQLLGHIALDVLEQLSGISIIKNKK